MRIISIIIGFGLFVSISGHSAIACSKDRLCTKDELKQNVAEARDTCKKAIAEIDNVPQSVFEPKISAIHFRTKATLKELNAQMDFTKYLSMVNDLKLLSGKNLTQNNALIDNWADMSEKGLNSLSIKVSENLRAEASFCLQPTTFIKSHLEKLKDAVKGKI